MINGIFRTGSSGSRGDATPSLIFVMHFVSLSPTLLRYVYASIRLKKKEVAFIFSIQLSEANLISKSVQ